jgi:2-haloacid dehalogenase
MVTSKKLLSVDIVRRYKPAPQVYHMAAEALYASTAEICMVSTHVWDTLGAQNVGCPAALIARASNAPPPKLAGLGWSAAPVAVGSDLPSVASQLIILWR